MYLCIYMSILHSIALPPARREWRRNYQVIREPLVLLTVACLSVQLVLQIINLPSETFSVRMPQVSRQTGMENL